MNVLGRSVWMLASLMPFAANAQSNYLDGDPIWACHELCNYGIANCFERDDYNLYLCGDTTITDTLYKKLCRRGTWERYWVFSQPSNCELGSYLYTWPAGYLREDGMRMYYRSDQTPDTLLYDFDLTIGDTLPSSFIHDPSNTGPLVVTFIDSLLVEADWRKRFHFNDDQTTLLMEGIGSTYGLLIPMTFNWACSTYLSCYGTGGASYYPEPNGDCDLQVTVNDLPGVPATLQIWPNPSQGEFRITATSDIDLVIITDQTGRVVRQVHLQGRPRTTMHLDLGAAGIYTVVARTSKGVISSRLIVLQ